jgi:hypothetical protein
MTATRKAHICQRTSTLSLPSRSVDSRFRGDDEALDTDGDMGMDSRLRGNDEALDTDGDMSMDSRLRGNDEALDTDGDMSMDSRLRGNDCDPQRLCLPKDINTVPSVQKCGSPLPPLRGGQASRA